MGPDVSFLEKIEWFLCSTSRNLKDWLDWKTKTFGDPWVGGLWDISLGSGPGPSRSDPGPLSLGLMPCLNQSLVLGRRHCNPVCTSAVPTQPQFLQGRGLLPIPMCPPRSSLAPLRAALCWGWHHGWHHPRLPCQLIPASRRWERGREGERGKKWRYFFLSLGTSKASLNNSCWVLQGSSPSRLC